MWTDHNSHNYQLFSKTKIRNIMIVMISSHLWVIIETSEKMNIWTWSKSLEFQNSWILKSLLNFCDNHKMFDFLRLKEFWNVLRVSNYYQSKALIIRNNFQCNNTQKITFFGFQTTGNSILACSKILYWKLFWGSDFLLFSRFLISEKICIFSFSQKINHREPT